MLLPRKTLPFKTQLRRVMHMATSMMNEMHVHCGLHSNGPIVAPHPLIMIKRHFPCARRMTRCICQGSVLGRRVGNAKMKTELLKRYRVCSPGSYSLVIIYTHFFWRFLRAFSIQNLNMSTRARPIRMPVNDICQPSDL